MHTKRFKGILKMLMMVERISSGTYRARRDIIEGQKHPTVPSKMQNAKSCTLPSHVIPPLPASPREEPALPRQYVGTKYAMRGDVTQCVVTCTHYFIGQHYKQNIHIAICNPCIVQHAQTNRCAFRIMVWYAGPKKREWIPPKLKQGRINQFSSMHSPASSLRCSRWKTNGIAKESAAKINSPGI